MNPIILYRLGCGLALLWLSLVPCAAVDYSTTNREALSRFWDAAEAKARPVTVVSFGDSMAESYRTATFYLMTKLEGRLGIAGNSLINYGLRLLPQMVGGSTLLYNTTNWFTAHWLLPPGGGLWWENYFSAGGLYCDQIGLFYVRQPQGGLITLSISTNAGTWSPQLVLDGYHPTPIGAYTNIALPRNLYRLRVDGLSGTNFVIGPQALDTQTNGLHVVFMCQPGLPLYGVTDVPTAIRAPIFAALKPDLLVWHMKEPIEPLLSDMEECENWWSNSAPECDVLYIGTPWAVTDTTNTWTTEQNQIVRGVAVNHRRAYVDLMQPGNSYDWLRTNGLISDGIHLTDAGGQWGANIIWNDMNLFALGLPRQLSLMMTGGLARVAFPTAPGATYTLQSSTNLQDWLTEMTTPGMGSVIVTNLPASAAQRSYRLRLTPN